MERLENHSQFTERLVDVIVSWPLYKMWSFVGKVTLQHLAGMGGGGVLGSTPYVLVPSEVLSYCSQCGYELRWELQTSNRNVFSIDGGFTDLVYACRNCGTKAVYILKMTVNVEGGNIIKVGQFPALEREPPKALASAMSEQDIALYKHALTCRNSNYGIGAVAYLRRIVENRINDLLDLIADAAEAAEPNSALVKRLAEMKGEKRFSEKIGYAAEMLPQSLRRGGHNPIATLHDLASDGLHARSDDECVEIFDRCKLAFEYVIKRLKESHDEDASYQQAIKSISGKRVGRADG